LKKDLKRSRMAKITTEIGKSGGYVKIKTIPGNLKVLAATTVYL